MATSLQFSNTETIVDLTYADQAQYEKLACSDPTTAPAPIQPIPLPMFDKIPLYMAEVIRVRATLAASRVYVDLIKLNPQAALEISNRLLDGLVPRCSGSEGTTMISGTRIRRTMSNTE